MSRRSCIIEKKVRQYQQWYWDKDSKSMKARRPSRSEAMVAVTRPGKFPSKKEAANA